MARIGRPPIYPPVCSIDGCEKPSRTRGWCKMHYNRWKRRGDPLLVRGPKVEVPSYGAVHWRLRNWRGRPSDFSCVDCGGQAREWSMLRGAGDLVARNGVTYSSNLDDYEPRCTGCHRIYDENPLNVPR